MMNQLINSDVEVEAITLKELLLNSVEEFADEVFCKTRKPDKTYEIKTYQQLLEEVENFGAVLLEKGAKPGDRIAFSGENRFEWVVTYFAVTAGGMIGVPIDPNLKSKEIEGIINVSDCEIVVIAPKLIEKYQELLPRCSSVKKTISMGLGENGIVSWAEANKLGKDPNTREEWRAREVEIDTIAVYLFTSGTTGQSKAAILTHGNLGGNAVQILQANLLEDKAVFLSLLPLHHTFEATTGMLYPMLLGCSMTYARSLKSKEIVEDIRDTGVNVMIGVPLLYEKMLGGMRRVVAEKGGVTAFLFNFMFSFSKIVYDVIGVNPGKALFSGFRAKAGLSTMMYFVSGAAPLTAEISKAFFILGMPVLQGYGLTETSPVLSVNRPNAIKFASVGPPVPGVEVRIENPDENGEGEILAKGINIFVGYLNNEKLTEETLIEDGWVKTGDSGYLDRDGNLYITGRLKNVIVNASGKNIHPEEVEAELAASPFICEVMVLSAYDKEANHEMVGAIVFPDYEYFERYAETEGFNCDDEYIDKKVRAEVNLYCRKLATYKRVKVLHIRKEEFPKTTTRKIKRYLFKEGIRADEKQDSKTESSTKVKAEV